AGDLAVARIEGRERAPAGRRLELAIDEGAPRFRLMLGCGLRLNLAHRNALSCFVALVVEGKRASSDGARRSYRPRCAAPPAPAWSAAAPSRPSWRSSPRSRCWP